MPSGKCRRAVLLQLFAHNPVPMLARSKAPLSPCPHLLTKGQKSGFSAKNFRNSTYIMTSLEHAHISPPYLCSSAPDPHIRPITHRQNILTRYPIKASSKIRVKSSAKVNTKMLFPPRAGGGQKVNYMRRLPRFF